MSGGSARRALPAYFYELCISRPTTGEKEQTSEKKQQIIRHDDMLSEYANMIYR